MIQEVARFRRLTPARRVQAIRDLIAAGVYMARISPRTEFLHKYISEQETFARHTIRDFLTRHAGG